MKVNHHTTPFEGWQGLGFALGGHLMDMGTHPGELGWEKLAETESLAGALISGARVAAYDISCSKIIEDFSQRGRLKGAG